VAAGHAEPDGKALPFDPQGEGDGEGLLGNVGGEQVGPAIAEAEGEQPVALHHAGQQCRFLVVEVEHGRVRLADEVAEQAAELVHRLVVEGDVGEHGDFRLVERDRAVALVYFTDERVAGPRQRTREGRVGGDEILHHGAVHHDGIAAERVQDPADHAGGGRFAGRAADRDRVRRLVEQAGQKLRAREVIGAETAGGLHVRHRLLDRGGGDQQLVGAPHAAAVLRVQADALAFQEGEFVGDPALVERAVRAFDMGALGTDDTGEREHAAAPDPAEEIGIGLAHGAALWPSATKGNGESACGSRSWRRAAGSTTTSPNG
jgi:hypothetical protein